MVVMKDNQIYQRNTERLLQSPETDTHVQDNWFIINLPLQLNGEMMVFSINNNEASGCIYRKKKLVS